MAIVAYQMCFYLRVRLEPVLEKALQAEEAWLDPAADPGSKHASKHLQGHLGKTEEQNTERRNINSTGVTADAKVMLPGEIFRVISWPVIEIIW